MKRRAFLVAGVATLGIVAVTGRYAAQRQVGHFGDTDIASRLTALLNQPLHSRGAWSPFQIFSHLAQSIEYSLIGYPESKPAWFQQSIGAAAFTAFSAAGSMTHSLSEPIPGAPALPKSDEPHHALIRLLTALQTFDAHTGRLASHFAYGELSKAQYRAAHVMHINNHLTEISNG